MSVQNLLSCKVDLSLQAYAHVNVHLNNSISSCFPRFYVFSNMNHMLLKMDRSLIY